MYGDLGSPGLTLEDNIKKDENNMAGGSGLVSSGSTCVPKLVLETQ